MTPEQQALIDSLISQIRQASAEGSVTNEMVARVLDAFNSDGKFFLDSIKSLDRTTISINEKIGRPNGIAGLNASGIVPDNQLPQYRDILVSLLFKQAFGDNREYKAIDSTAINNFLTNGYYPDAAPDKNAPYYAYGIWLTRDQAIKALMDVWHPGATGVTPNAAVNKVPYMNAVEDSAMNLNLSFLCTNNWKPKVIALGTNGWESVVRPLSIRRAFHAANNLMAVVGIIDLIHLSEPVQIFKAFADAPRLSFFLLRNLPDCITELDLSGCGNIAETLMFQTTTNYAATSTLDFLYANFNLNANRTQPLRVKVPNGTPYDGSRYSDNPLFEIEE